MENPCPECGHVCDCNAHVEETASAEPITHEWLKSVGFRWAEWERSGGKHWILWFGNCREERELSSAAEDVGIELRNPSILSSSAGHAGFARTSRTSTVALSIFAMSGRSRK